MKSAMKSSLPFPISLTNQEKEVPSETESLILILESIAKFRIASAKMVTAYADAFDKYVESSLAEELTKSGVHKGVTLLSHLNWMGEMNILLALLTTKHTFVFTRVIRYEEKKGIYELWDSSVNRLKASVQKWGTALVRLLNLLHSLLQKANHTNTTSGRYYVLTILKLKQVTEMILNVDRIESVAFPMNGITEGNTIGQDSLFNELKKLEHTWIYSTFCEPEQRNTVLVQIRQLQRWMSGAQQHNVHAQPSASKPWLNNGKSTKKQSKSRKRTNS